MNPIDFPESNLVLGKPRSVTEEQCGSLPVAHCYNEWGPFCLSCWQPTEEERKAIADGGNIWVWVIAGINHQPPISVSGINPYKEENEDD